MTRALAMLATLLLVVRPLATPGPDQQATFRTTTEVVTVNVTVAKGRTPITGLTAPDFVLLDDGVMQTVMVEPADSMLIDLTIAIGAGLTSERAQIVRGGLDAARLGRLLRPTDRIRVVAFGETVRELSPLQPAASWTVPSLVRATASSTPARISLVDGLFYALAREVAPDRRHLVVVFTEGFDTWSALDPARLPALVGRSDSVIHAVLYQSPPNAPTHGGTGTLGAWISADGSTRLSPDRVDRWRSSYRALDHAVQASGGSLHHLESGMAAFDNVIGGFRTGYVLRYSPRDVKSGGWHTIAVKLSRSGAYAINARQGYAR